MRTERVEFYSTGEVVAGLWRTPGTGAGPFRAIVQGPGWMGLKDAKLYEPYQQALTDAGFAVLVIDYRGFGDSGGRRDLLSPIGQVQDLVNAVTYLTTRDDVQADAIGTFGTGGTGGGNAVLLAAADERVKAAVSQVPVADGADWLHRMRSEHEWLAFLAELDEDRRQRVISGKSRMVRPHEDIAVPTPERRAAAVKADVDDRVPTTVLLSSAEEILAYRPVDAASQLHKPLQVIGVERDATTPTDHARWLYEAAHGPKQLIMLRHTSHYAAYERYWTQTTPRITAWLDRYVRAADVVVTSDAGDRSGEQIEFLEVSEG